MSSRGMRYSRWLRRLVYLTVGATVPVALAGCDSTSVADLIGALAWSFGSDERISFSNDQLNIALKAAIWLLTVVAALPSLISLPR